MSFVFQLKALVMEAAESIYAPLDEQFTNVQRLQNGVLHVTASCANFPDNEKTFELMRSALHIVIQECVQSAVAETPDVRVIVPTPVTNMPDFMASFWISEQLKGVQDYVRQANEDYKRAACMRVLHAYPWRDKRTMLENIWNVCNVLQQDGQCFFDVDTILPPIRSLLSESECTNVVEEVKYYLNKTPSLLEIYEVVFLLVTYRQNVCHSTCALYIRLFGDAATL